MNNISGKEVVIIKVKFISLGCPKNQVDSEFMQGLISQQKQLKLIDDSKDAEVIIINTCGFIEDAKKESIDTILQAAQLKKSGNCRALIVTGCLTQRYREEIFDQIPEIDAVLGTGDYEQILSVIANQVENQRINLVAEPEFRASYQLPRQLDVSHFAYLKIAEGCNNRCSYCVIPQIRGPVKSRPVEDIYQEAVGLVERGIKEIILVAQDISMYGVDLYGQAKLLELLHRLLEVETPWLRLLYCYPERVSDSLIEIIRENQKICNYLDLPVQHASNKIRKLMERQGSKEELLAIFRKLRSEIPDISLRSSLICGFPGESEKDFAELLEFIKEVKFDRLGVFKYSREEGTKAALMENQIPEKVKQQRYDILMETQREISREKNMRLQDKELEVLIDHVYSDYASGRTQYDAPEIDNQVILEQTEDLKEGDLIKCRIKETFEYDLIGEKI